MLKASQASGRHHTTPEIEPSQEPQTRQKPLHRHGHGVNPPPPPNVYPPISAAMCVGGLVRKFEAGRAQEKGSKVKRMKAQGSKAKRSHPRFRVRSIPPVPSCRGCPGKPRALPRQSHGSRCPPKTPPQARRPPEERHFHTSEHRPWTAWESGLTRFCPRAGTSSRRPTKASGTAASAGPDVSCSGEIRTLGQKLVIIIILINNIIITMIINNKTTTNTNSNNNKSQQGFTVGGSLRPHRTPRPWRRSDPDAATPHLIELLSICCESCHKLFNRVLNKSGSEWQTHIQLLEGGAFSRLLHAVPQKAWACPFDQLLD